MVVDTFMSLKFYESFLKSNDIIYQELSSKLKYLHKAEEKIGVFNDVV